KSNQRRYRGVLFPEIDRAGAPASISRGIRWRFCRETDENRVAKLHPASPVESLSSMHDPRFDQLAKLLVEYSTRLKRNETVLIETFDVPDEMTVALVRATRQAGAIPFAQVQHARVNRELVLNATERQLNLTALHELARM